MAGFILLLASALLYVGVVESQSLTRDNIFCNCFQINAQKTLGSMCFARVSPTFGGEKTVKKADHIKYIVETCNGASVPYEYGDGFYRVRASFADNTVGGGWVPVTGAAQVGDVIVTPGHLQMVTAVGRYPVLLSNGYKVVKRTNPTQWKGLKDAVGDSWRSCPLFIYANNIYPPNPRAQCSALPWTEQSPPSFTPRYWIATRAMKHRVKNTTPRLTIRGLRVFRFVPGQGSASGAFLATIEYPPQLDQQDETQPTYITFLDQGNVFDAPVFTPNSPGFYFGSLGAIVLMNKAGTMSLTGAAFTIGLEMRQTTTEGNTQVSRNLLMPFAADDSISTTYTGYLVAVPSTVSPNSWSMGQLDMSPLVALSVARENEWNTPGPVNFDVVMADTAGMFVTNVFTVPTSGLYYIGLSAGVGPFTGTELDILRNSVPIQKLKRLNLVHNDNDMISTAVLTWLDATDEIKVQLQAGGKAIATPTFMQTSLVAFLYSPRHGNKLAWSVSRNESWNATPGLDLWPMPFENVRVNVGNLWQETTNRVDISVTGIYYIHLSMALPANGKVEARVMNQDGEDVLYVYKDNSFQVADDVVSHGQLVPLNAGSWLQVWVADVPTAFKGDAALPITSFTGMLMLT